MTDAINTLPFGDGFYIGEMPSPADEDFRLAVATLHRDLAGVVHSDLAAFSLSHALNSIVRRAASRDYRLSERQAADLRFSLREALHAGEVNLPASVDRRALHAGMEAAECLVDHWARSDEDRKKLSTPAVLDAYGRARILQNACHNASIEEEIAERRQERQAHRSRGIVAEIAATLGVALPEMSGARR